MKYLFFVQTEGRGHMTQALALKEKLEARGHSIVGIIVGSKKGRQIPGFFTEQISCPIFVLESPKFLTDKNNKGVRIFASALLTISKTFVYLSSIREIRKIINDLQPDALINFYESLAGIYSFLYKEKRPIYIVGHHHFIEHSAFRFPRLSFLSRFSFWFYNHLTAGPNAIKLALSFTEEKDEINKKLFVCPPLIRKVFKESIPQDNGYILSYLVNHGYSEEIIKWAKENPNYSIKAFWDKPGQDETIFGQNLIFYYLSGERFINYLVNCFAYASTAGFDSIAEAAYLQKDILMIPTKNQFEQKCNAFDAERAGIAISAEYFNLTKIIGEKQKVRSKIGLIKFKDWVDKYDNKIVDILEGCSD